ncbi:MAG TPA: nucleotidyltransferase [Thermoanaerobaculia bacterium]|jgi:hypothetical protein|nr:nucleotidyltransferase [Thermoanaerobaculia bacterium]
MSIPLSQLNTWSHQGAIITSSNAYESIERALCAESAAPQVRAADVFLQGSYRNTTNIYGDSDVDVVVLYKTSFHSDKSALTPQAQRLHDATYPDATYLWRDLHADVLAALRSHFGYNAVTPGPKAITVNTGHGRLTADVVPALEFRKYATFNGANSMTAHWGIQFFDAAGNPIVNYLKLHIDRGEDKNSQGRTGGCYKPTVRIFKNLRNYLYDNGLIAEDSVPSYFLECTVHNVPDNLFAGGFSTSVPNILRHLWTTAPGDFRCQNGVVPLFGPGPTQWSQDRFTAFVTAAVNAWDNW